MPIKNVVTRYEKTGYDGNQSVKGRKTIKFLTQKWTELLQVKAK